MPVLVTVSLNLAESVSLRELRAFVETAEDNGADVRPTCASTTRTTSSSGSPLLTGPGG
jgi:hypothetical protein